MYTGMNLFKLAELPQDLDYFKEQDYIPIVLWEKLEGLPFAEFKKYERVWARDPDTAYTYALILNGPFPLGEAIIAKSASHSYWYARYVLSNSFPLGEDAISKENYYATLYEIWVRDCVLGIKYEPISFARRI